MIIYQVEHNDYDEHTSYGHYSDRQTAEKIANNLYKITGTHYDVEEYVVDDPENMVLNTDHPKAWFSCDTTRCRFYQLDTPITPQNEKYHPANRDAFGMNFFSVVVLAESLDQALVISRPLLAERKTQAQEEYKEMQERWDRHLKHQ